MNWSKSCFLFFLILCIGGSLHTLINVSHAENISFEQQLSSSLTAPSLKGTTLAETDAAVTLQPEEYPDDEYNDWEDDIESDSIADPFEPVNRLLFQFNDKLYFWALKPVAQGYAYVIPEPARDGISNFFSNVLTPLRMANCMLQLDAQGFFQELARFIINTTAGCLGFRDAAFKDYNIKKHEVDFGQTLATWGAGNGFYLVLPFFGPSSLRDGIGLGVNYLMDPWTYILDQGALIAAYSVNKINDVSLRIGEYEDFKASALDPYISMREAYADYRKKQISRAGNPWRTLGVTD